MNYVDNNLQLGRSFKCNYAKGYLNKLLKLPREALKQRLQNAKESIEYLETALKNRAFRGESEVCAIARLWKERGLLRYIAKRADLDISDYSEFCAVEGALKEATNGSEVSHNLQKESQNKAKAEPPAPPCEFEVKNRDGNIRFLAKPNNELFNPTHTKGAKYDYL